jgi:hypothetical protein
MGWFASRVHGQFVLCHILVPLPYKPDCSLSPHLILFSNLTANIVSILQLWTRLKIVAISKNPLHIPFIHFNYATVVMGRTMTGAFLAYLVSSLAAAQNVTTPTCSILGNLLKSNASITREIPAYSISKDVYLGDDKFPNTMQSFHIENDTSRRWSLSLRVHQSRPEISTQPDYQQTLLLDTVDSNATRMGMCHQYIQAYDARQGGYRWKKEVLKRSLTDNGDCKTMLGNECVDALARHYKRQAINQLSEGSCFGTNNTVPTECGEMLETTVRGKWRSIVIRNDRIIKLSISLQI